MNRRPGPTRRRLLQSFGGAAVAGPLATFLPRTAHAGSGVAERVIFFYFPDGVPGPSQNGEASAWHASGSEFSFSLGSAMSPLGAYQQDCVFFSGLSSGPTDSGSHPGGAQKLLTATDHGGGESIDQYLARTVGASNPWHHLYLGAQATADGATGDKHISYPTGGVSIPPEDDPRAAFSRLFGAAPLPPAPGTSPEKSVLDTAVADLLALQSRLGATERTKLDLHLQSLRELEQRLGGISGGGDTDPVLDEAQCSSPTLDTGGVTDSTLFTPEVYPDLVRAQIDLMVLAMACGITRVGTLQCSYHTSELLMSRFPGTAMYDPSFDMRSHQASHYGASHSGQLYDAFHLQVQWWTEQFAYLLERLRTTPEGDGTMLDHTIAVLCTEVCDGNTHAHDDLPFVLAGRAGGRISTGRRLDVGYRRHGDLWISVAEAMGQPTSWFGDASSGPIPGLLS
ncbi:MAG: DUF1552 domain-containing protein [Myxococcota bacterium]